MRGTVDNGLRGRPFCDVFSEEKSCSMAEVAVWLFFVLGFNLHVSLRVALLRQ